MLEPEDDLVVFHRLVERLLLFEQAVPHAQQFVVMRLGEISRARFEVTRRGTGRERLAKGQVIAGDAAPPCDLRDDVAVMYVFHGSMRTATQKRLRRSTRAPPILRPRAGSFKIGVAGI